MDSAPASSPAPVLVPPDLSNEAFLSRYAGPARIGLAGGSAFIDRGIRKAQSPLTPARAPSRWSHAFLFSGVRVDRHHWVIESDLEIHRKQIRLGVQENRASKYFDAAEFPNLAVLDFHLDPEQVEGVLSSALDVVSGLARYSLRELVGTVLAMERPALRGKENLFAREGALYCSAFVQHCFASIGVDFTPGVETKNTTPEDIARTGVPHAAYLLLREPGVEPRA